MVGMTGMIRIAPFILVLASALAAAAAVAQDFIEDRDYWMKPAVFPGRSDLSHHPMGPQKAKGLVIWNHGYNPDKMAPEKVPPVMQYFAETGWDAYHLQRHSLIGIGRGRRYVGGSNDLTTPLILHVLERAEIKAYARIVLMGQSRGAYAVINIGSFRPKVTGILPLAPAAFGDAGKSNDWRQNDFYIRELWETFKDSGIRVAAGFFTDDDWFERQQPHVRGPYARKRLTELGVANFIVNQPDYYDMQGHGGGQSWEFARRFGPCLEYFFDTGKSPSCVEHDATTAAIYRIRLPSLPSPDGFTGLWQGTWKNGRFYSLVLQPDAGGKYKGSYHAGLGVNGDKPETTTWSLVKDGNALVRERTHQNNAHFRLSLQEPDRLQVDWLSSKGDRPTTVIFSRAR
jgi:hypothetical protein